MGKTGDMIQDIAEVLITEEEIKAKTKELAQRITQDYQGKDLLLVCILKGGMMFLADLMREIEIPLDIDFMAISSYGDATESTGVCGSSWTWPPPSRGATSSSWRIS